MQLNYYKRLLAIAQTGLFYAQDEFDKERYQEIKEITLKLIEETGLSNYNNLLKLTNAEDGYPTPKIDVRAFIQSNDKFLLVEDSKTKEWSLPGGFAEIGISPKENILKEVKEETGLDVSVDSLGGLFDTNLQLATPQLFQYYKLVFKCSVIKGKFIENLETSNAQFFDINNLPKLSEKRTTKQQLLQLISPNIYFE